MASHKVLALHKPALVQSLSEVRREDERCREIRQSRELDNKVGELSIVPVNDNLGIFRKSIPNFEALLLHQKMTYIFFKSENIHYLMCSISGRS